MLIPRMSATERMAIAAPANGLLLYDTDSTAFGYYNGSNWLFLKRSMDTSYDWNTRGNAGTNPGTDFIGTTDNNPLYFRVDNLPTGKIDNKNIFWGNNSGTANTGGYSNVAIGTRALVNNTVGHNLVAVGDSALFNQVLSADYNNTAVGSKTLFANTTGWFNTAIGSNALFANTTASGNTAVGYETLLLNTTGANNTAAGNRALRANIAGSNNTAFGSATLYENTTGNHNSAIGYQALLYNKTGTGNTATGYTAMYYNSTGNYNSTFGMQALSYNTTGSYNSAAGYSTLLFNVSGSNNSALGSYSMLSNMNGNSNVAIGAFTLANNRINSNLVAIGDSSLLNSGHYQGVDYSVAGNTALGSKALYTDYNGSYNTAIGSLAAYTGTGSSNTALGHQAQYNTTGNFNTLIGKSAFITGTFNNWTAIGYNTGAGYSASNSVELGNSSVSLVRGQVNYSTFSDRRIKDNIEENVPGLRFISLLKPVTYNLNIHRQNQLMYGKEKPDTVNWEGKYDIEKIKMTGFIAQDVEAAANQVGYNFSAIQKPVNDKGLYSISYAEFTVPLVKAVQEQQVQIEELKTANNNLQKQLERLIKIIEALKQAGSK